MTMGNTATIPMASAPSVRQDFSVLRLNAATYRCTPRSHRRIIDLVAATSGHSDRSPPHGNCRPHVCLLDYRAHRTGAHRTAWVFFILGVAGHEIFCRVQWLRE